MFTQHKTIQFVEEFLQITTIILVHNIMIAIIGRETATPSADCAIKYIDLDMSVIAVLTSYISLSRGQCVKAIVRIRIIYALSTTSGWLFVLYVQHLIGLRCVPQCS